MTKRNMTDQDLDQLFETARRSVPEPDPGFLAALGDTAVAALDPLAAPTPRPEAVWTQIATWLGGWGGVGGLIAATAAGVWIGVSPPAVLPDAAAFFSTTASEVSGFGVWVDVDRTDLLAQDES